MKLVDIFELIDTEEEAHDPVGAQQFAQRVVGVQRHVVQQRFRQQHNLQRRRRHRPPQRPVLHTPLRVQTLRGRIVLIFAALQRFPPPAAAAAAAPRTRVQPTAVHQALHIPRYHSEKSIIFSHLQGCSECGPQGPLVARHGNRCAPLEINEFVRNVP